MARVKKVHTPKPCKCGSEVKVCQWTDTIKPGKNATWIECPNCEMMTKSFHSKDAELAKNKAIISWNKSARRRKIKGGLRSCEKCGSNDVKLLKFKHSINVSYMVNCEGCGLMTDEIDNDGNLRTEKQAKELWNK